ncbi:MTH865 family protein [Salinibaculum rarum]|uniref:MTH865 family protein n=1 Tax=Salinibaculum rarum TaxID=3058903 RepID=UPI0026602597|nr:MTH865 family protein [Salinibaculum sp. KK48]
MTAENPEEEIREQLVAVFGQAEYPVVDPMELIPVLPDGAATTFEAPGVSLGAMELGMGYAEYQDYPYDDVEALVADLMTGLRDDGVFE